MIRRNYSYLTVLFEASGQYVESFIFNTGPVPSKKVAYVNETMFFNPSFFNTQEKLEIANLNNLRYKIINKEELTQYDCLDLIWLVKSGIDVDKEDLLYELTVEIWAKAVAPKWMLDAIRKNLIIWAKKYLVDDVKIEKFKRVIKMSKLEVRPFEEQIRGAGIAGQLERAEKSGFNEGREIGIDEGREIGIDEGREIGIGEGREIGQNEIISKLLEKYSPEEISEMIDESLDKILEIKNDV